MAQRMQRDVPMPTQAEIRRLGARRKARGTAVTPLVRCVARPTAHEAFFASVTRSRTSTRSPDRPDHDLQIIRSPDRSPDHQLTRSSDSGIQATLRSTHDRSASAVRQAPRAQTRVAESPRAGFGELSAAARHHARPQAEHRLRGRPLPQHRRVLAPRHGDVHDPRRHLHPGLRLLRRRARQAAGARSSTSPAASPKRWRQMRLQVRGHHLGRSRRSAGRRRRHLRGDHPRDQARACPTPGSRC